MNDIQNFLQTQENFTRKLITYPIKSINESEHTIDFILTKDVLDRDGERVIPRGVSKHLQSYLDNPVVLWAHKASEPPIARAIDVQVTDDMVVARDKFSVDEYDFAATIWKLYTSDPPTLRATSIGFIPKAISNEEKDRLPNQHGRTYVEWEMLEHSAVCVPSNPEALSRAYMALKPTLDPHDKQYLEEMIEKAKIGQAEDKPDSNGKLYAFTGLYTHHGLPIFKSAKDEDIDTSQQPDFIKRPDDTESHLKPFPNEHACRLRNPDDFERGSFRSREREHDGKPYRVIMGRLQGQQSMTEQAYRYPKSEWTVAQAQSHCDSHDGILFEPASSEQSEQVETEEKSRNMPFIGGEFTLPNTYERDTRDIREALMPFKRELFGDEHDHFVTVGINAEDVICYSNRRDTFYRIDWERDDSGQIQLSNARVVEIGIVGEGSAMSVSPGMDDGEDDDDGIIMFQHGDEVITAEIDDSDDETYDDGEMLLDFDTLLAESKDDDDDDVEPDESEDDSEDLSDTESLMIPESDDDTEEDEIIDINQLDDVLNNIHNQIQQLG